MNTHVVIMAGGIGSRLWPVSTPSKPKQFIDMLGLGKTLIQLTAERFMPLCGPSGIWVVTSAGYVSDVRAQLPFVPEDQILAEPVARSTAPCIAYACWKIMMKDPQANVVVTPSDAIVLKTEKFRDCIRKALEFTEKSGSIVTIGIHPSRPETGYGYICSSVPETDAVVKVDAFKEKPDAVTAQKYIDAGNYFWNAGIFVWTVQTIVEQLRKFAPQIAGVMDRLAPALFTPEEKYVLAKLFPTCEKISIDYAVMEKSDSIYVIASDLEWSDLGSWSSIGEKSVHDEHGNTAVGPDVRLNGCENCIVHASGPGMVVVNGLKDYIVAESGGNILVCPISDDQRIKEFTEPKRD